MAAIPTILKGDDSGSITLTIATGRTYTGATLVIAYQGVTRSFTNLTPGQTIAFSFAHDETAAFELKTAPILMRLIGPYGGEETVENAEARIKVTDCMAEVNAGGSFIVQPGGGALDPTKVPITDVGDMSSRYTLADLQAKVNQIVRVLAQRSLLALAAVCGTFAAFGITTQTARLDSLYNDSFVVTNVIGGADIPDYTTTNAVRDIASSASITNAGAVAVANAGLLVKADKAELNPLLNGSATNTVTRGFVLDDPDYGNTLFEFTDTSYGEGWYFYGLAAFAESVKWGDIEETPNLCTSNDLTTATNVLETAITNKADKSELAGKQDELPYATNAIPAGVISGAPWIETVTANANFVPWVTDSVGNKTAVTIGSRPTLDSVDEWSGDEYYRQNMLVKKAGIIYICTIDCQSCVEPGSWESQADYWREVTIGVRSFTQGYNNVAGVQLDAEGDGTHAEGNGTHAEGGGTHAEGSGTHAEGYSTHAEGNGTHAEGDGTHAEGDSTHAEGDSTHAEGDSTHAEGYSTHAGRTPTDEEAEEHGWASWLFGTASHAAGWGAEATNQTAFAWQGIPKEKNAYTEPTATEKYYDHGAGTYNINPVGGLSGFYIGEQNLTQINAGILSSAENTAGTIASNVVAEADTTYAAYAQITNVNQSVQSVSVVSGGSLTILAPTASVKDWIVYANCAADNTALVLPAGQYYASDTAYTNALKAGVTAFYFTSCGNGIVIGRQELKPITVQ